MSLCESRLYNVFTTSELDITILEATKESWCFSIELLGKLLYLVFTDSSNLFMKSLVL
jgi:hypothetical protein